MNSTRWLLGAALAAALAGCGGDDGLDQAALSEQTNEICSKYAKEGEALGQPDLADPETAQEYFSAAEELARRQQDELEALVPVEDLQADYDKLTAATAKATTLLGDLADAAAEQDKERGDELLNQLPALSTEVDDAAGTIGANECAS